jgi:hypothetical protein
VISTGLHQQESYASNYYLSTVVQESDLGGEDQVTNPEEYLFRRACILKLRVPEIPIGRIAINSDWADSRGLDLWIAIGQIAIHDCPGSSSRMRSAESLPIAISPGAVGPMMVDCSSSWESLVASEPAALWERSAESGSDQQQLA